jgi:hypothetical protein
MFPLLILSLMSCRYKTPNDNSYLSASQTARAYFNAQDETLSLSVAQKQRWLIPWSKSLQEGGPQFAVADDGAWVAYASESVMRENIILIDASGATHAINLFQILSAEQQADFPSGTSCGPSWASSVNITQNKAIYKVSQMNPLALEEQNPASEVTISISLPELVVTVIPAGVRAADEPVFQKAIYDYWAFQVAMRRAKLKSLAMSHTVCVNLSQKTWAPGFADFELWQALNDANCLTVAGNDFDLARLLQMKEATQIDFAVAILERHSGATEATRLEALKLVLARKPLERLAIQLGLSDESIEVQKRAWFQMAQVQTRQLSFNMPLRFVDPLCKRRPQARRGPWLTTSETPVLNRMQNIQIPLH